MEENLWQNFEKSGKIEDYLKYKGIKNIDGDFINGGINEATKSEGDSNKGSTI